TPFMVLLAGWAALLRRYTRQPWINVGTTTAGRDRGATAGLVGFFVNTLVLRTPVAGDPAFEGLLARVRRTTLDAYARRDVPFERLVDELRPQRDLSTTPFFQTVLTFHQGETGEPALSGLGVESLPTGTRTAKFDLELEVSWRRGGGGARVNLEYATDLFDATTVRRFGHHLARLLAGAAAEPGLPLSALPLLSAAERTQVLGEWNDSAAAEVPRDTTFAELFAARVARHPDRVAVTCGDLAVSYGELARRADRLARRLVARGFGPEQVVALFALRNADALAAILAVFKAGGAYVPLDPLHPTRRLSGVLAASGARLALVAGALAAEMERVAEPLDAARRPEVLELAAALEPAADGARQAAADTVLSAGDPRHLAYVIFTSGSTGKPKGAMLEQRGMVNHLWAKVLDLGLTEHDVVAQTSNISFDVHVWQFLVALAAGGRTDVFDDEQSLDARRLLARLEEQAVSVVETVPSQLRVLLEEAERLAAARPRLRPLRWMIPNGEVLPPELCERWFAAYPATAMINAYGPTECSDDVLHHAMRAAPPQDEAVPIGRPLPNLRLYVLGEAFEPVPLGVVGDLYVAGAGVGRGYLDDPRRTAVTFLPNPLPAPHAAAPGERLYRTGDRARWRADGGLDFLGRVDFQVKVRGFRIEPGEIEAALRTHPGIDQAVVLARRDAGRDLYLCAYLVTGRPLTVAEVQEHAADRVPPYMVPARFVFLD
ncbi:MAG TPA: amino acid adenylation domain-containing protein, partial [Thermoanaerobaculia bacterium]|nr:amino acid adenylation domain-containing protein [Thermoanaerobaculia bacterium]